MAVGRCACLPRRHSPTTSINVPNASHALRQSDPSALVACEGCTGQCCRISCRNAATLAAPQDARDFGVDGYTLRLQRMDRKIKLFICVTLYNEDYDELRKTLVGICDVSCRQRSWW